MKAALYMMEVVQHADQQVQRGFDHISRWLQETLHINPYRWGTALIIVGDCIGGRYNVFLWFWLLIHAPLLVSAWNLRPTEDPTLQQQLVWSLATRLRMGTFLSLLIYLPPLIPLMRDVGFVAQSMAVGTVHLGLLFLAGSVIPPSQYRRVEIRTPAVVPIGR